MRVLDNEASILRSDEKIGEPLGIVVDDEQPRAGGIQPAEAQVGGPNVALIVVLEEALDAYRRGGNPARVREPGRGDRCSDGIVSSRRPGSF